MHDPEAHDEVDRLEAAFLAVVVLGPEEGSEDYLAARTAWRVALRVHLERDHSWVGREDIVQAHAWLHAH